MVNFGVPNQRARKQEKYPDTPVVTFKAIDGESKGKSRKISFNPKAVETLKLDKKATVCFLFSDSIVGIANGNQTGIPEKAKLKVTKNTPRRVSHKKTYDFASKKLGFTVETGAEYELRKANLASNLEAYQLYPVGSSDESEALSAYSTDVKQAETITQ